MASNAAIITPHNVAVLTQKLYDADSDIRYMSLNDLSMVFHSQSSSFLAHDYNQCAKIVDGFLHTLNDTNGEVQNMAIKCLGPFVLKIHPDILCPMIHKFANLTTENTVDSSISASAVRAVVVALPRPSPGTARAKSVQDAYSAISKVLIPRLVGYIVIARDEGGKSRPPPPKGLLEEDLEKGSDSNCMDVLIEVARCFGPMLQKAELQALLKISSQILESNRTGSVMKKKAIIALSTLAHYFSDATLSSFISNLIEKMKTPHLTPAQQKLYISVLGSLARAIPKQFSGHLKALAPFVLAVVSPQEMDEQMSEFADEEERDPQVDEVKEAALLTLDGFISHCREDMEKYMDDIINAALLYLKYDPNIAGEEEEGSGAEEENEDDEFDMDEDFEEEGGADDEDDMSWKARRCAAKLLDTIVSMPGKDILENPDTYNKIATTLLSRFKEREDAVRLEILATTAHLVRKTGEADSPLEDLNTHAGLEQTVATMAPSRKRRRGASDASMFDVAKFRRLTGSVSPETGSPPRDGLAANLANFSPELIANSLKLLNKNATPPTRLAIISLLKDLVVARHGNLGSQLGAVIEPVVESAKPAAAQNGYGSGNFQGASGSNLRTSALQLIAEIAKTHSSKSLQAQMPNIVSVIVEAMQTKQPAIACEALATAEQIIKALTPPRAASASKASQSHLEKFLDTTTSLIIAKYGDIEVRRKAIIVLGILLGRSAGKPARVQLITPQQHATAIELLWEVLRNETTRLAAVKAIETLAELTPGKDFFTDEWLGKVSLELGAQLRKSSRSLRGSSILALRALLSDARAPELDERSVNQLAGLLIPFFMSNDLTLLGPVLNLCSVLVKSKPTLVITSQFIQNLCSMMISHVAASLLNELSALVRVIAESSYGQPLMEALLKDVSVNGNPLVIGKVIGNLLYHGGNTLKVTIMDFRRELDSATDTQKKQLALSVLGEIGLLSGSSASLTPDLFISHFASKSDKVQLAAATALGRASAGPNNVQIFVPTILSRIQQHPEDRYIILHSIREILQNDVVSADILPFAGALWEASVSASQTEDNKAIGGECIANLVMIDPKRFLPALQAVQSDAKSSTRGLGIAALRDVFAGSDESYNKDLRPMIVEALTNMLRDADLENRRSALNAFNAAARNKPALMLPNIRQLLPLVMEHTHEDPSLIREVSMGPFKIKVDDGLEVRKGAYETLYSLMEIAPSRIDMVQLYDRVVAGIGDEHDIRTLCNLMITKLLVLAPEETSRRLDAIADKLRTVLNITLKENAVKQEHEKTEEAKKGAIKVAIELNKAFPAESGSGAAVSGPNWTHFWDWMRKEHSPMFKEVEKEMKEKDRA